MLKDFLIEAADREPVFGACDCALILADWWMRARGGPDPASEWRGTYSTADECDALLRARGGLWRVVGDLAARAGAIRTRAPKPGDIAVVELNGMHWGAIMKPSGRWFIKARRARVGLRSVVVRRAWSVL